MKILLCCAAGMSTSILVRKMQAFVLNEDNHYVIKAMDMDRAEKHFHDFDVILVGPQIRYALPKLKKTAEIHHIPIAVINPVDYGRNNVKEILEFAKTLVGKEI